MFLKIEVKLKLCSLDNISSSLFCNLKKRLNNIVKIQINGKINGLKINFKIFLSSEPRDTIHKKIIIEIIKALKPTIFSLLVSCKLT